MFRKIFAKTLTSMLLVTLVAFSTQRVIAQQTYTFIKFVIQTGNDDLRTSSSASAILQSPSGQNIQVLQLKAQNMQGWDVNTNHSIMAKLERPMKASEIGRVVIMMQSHNAPFQTDDNWNVQSVTVTLLGDNGLMLDMGGKVGSPLARLTTSNPSFVMPIAPIGQGANNQQGSSSGGSSGGGMVGSIGGAINKSTSGNNGQAGSSSGGSGGASGSSSNGGNSSKAPAPAPMPAPMPNRTPAPAPAPMPN
jgi:hypothetical protein